MGIRDSGLVIWDIDGTLIPADIRWLRRAVARTYRLDESDVVFLDNKVHGFTDEPIVVESAVASGIPPLLAEAGIPRFREVLAAVMAEGREELALVQPPYPGAAETISELHRYGFAQTVLTGNLRLAAQAKLETPGLDKYLDLRIGGFGSDDRDRLRLPGVIARRYREIYGRDVDPRRTVIVGDAPNDVACARHAGFFVVAVAHRAARDELESCRPDAVVDRLDPDELTAIVNSLVSTGGAPSTG